jgi:hypothetical protein
MVYINTTPVNKRFLDGLNHQEADQLEVFEPCNLPHQSAGFARREQAQVLGITGLQVGPV